MGTAREEHTSSVLRAETCALLILCRTIGFTGSPRDSIRPRARPASGHRRPPINPIALALAAGARFVSRGYAGELKHLAWVIGQALEYPGYALVDVLQPCVTWNRSYSYDFYRDRVYKLEDEKGYDPTDTGSAWEKAVEWGDAIPIGIMYRADPIPTYEDQVPALAQGPLVAQGIATLDSKQIQTLRNEIG